MGDNDGTWKCPGCEVTAVVEGRDITLYMVGHTFPLHGGCEFGNEIDKIDFSKLEKIAGGEGEGGGGGKGKDKG